MCSLLLTLLLQLQIPAPVGYVNDFAHVVQPAESVQMAAVIEQVRAKSGGEIVVVTLPDIGGRASIDVARDIGRQWKVGAQGNAGDRRRNAGVVLLLKPGRRPGDGQSDIAVATGSGAEGFVTDALAGQIRDAIGREAVATGSFGAGLVQGVRLLGEAYGREFGFELTGAPEPRGGRPQAGGGRGGGFPWGFVILLLVLLMVGRRARRGFVSGMIWGALMNSSRGGGWSSGGGGGGGFGGFGGGGGFSGGGASGKF